MTFHGLHLYQRPMVLLVLALCSFIELFLVGLPMYPYLLALCYYTDPEVEMPTLLMFLMFTVVFSNGVVKLSEISVGDLIIGER